MSAMDEWRAIGGWLAGRRGNGFVAITTDGGCAAVGEPSFSSDGVDHRGLSLRWDLPFTRDGQHVPLNDLHLDNPLVELDFG